ncbi:MAG: substrate-binding domain-containing protein, partial [Dehalococcoidia bacterium]|nr:substrate-binding domain-containing protein [Dehalococcoidia bacterium]
MSRLRKCLTVLVVIMLLLVSVAGCTKPNVTLKVFAAASMQNALTELNKLYTQENPDVKIEPNFAASGALQQGIQHSPNSCDIFLSAAAAQMNNLENHKLLLENSRKNLLINNIVLI